jgi:hypothetical protein
LRFFVELVPEPLIARYLMKDSACFVVVTIGSLTLCISIRMGFELRFQNDAEGQPNDIDQDAEDVVPA